MQILVFFLLQLPRFNLIKYNYMEDQPTEKTYILDKKVTCPKHPSKNIEYFCRFPQCTDRLFCSSCLLKKQYCRHQLTQHIVDISQYLYQQNLAYTMRGLSRQPDIHDYLVNREQRRKMYTDVINAQQTKFEVELDETLRAVTNIIEELRESVRAQMQEFVVSYTKMEETLVKRSAENFELSYLAKWKSFGEIFQRNDCATVIGLREVLEKMTFQIGDQNKVKEIRKIYDSLISMQDETPEIDYARYDNIKTYFKVFENKLAQAGPSLITLHKSNQPQQKQQPKTSQTANIPILSIRKIANSANFNTNHSRTIYSIVKLPDKKICTGGDDGLVKMFDLSNFDCIVSFQAHQSGIRSMVLLNNGQLVTGSYDKTIRIWNNPLEILNMSSVTQKSVKNAYTPIKTLLSHTSCVIALIAIPQGNLLASGSADYTIKIWDLEKGEVIKNFTGHMNDVLCFATTTNGLTLLSGSADRTIKIWNLSKKYSSASLKTLTGHTDFIWTILLLPDDVTLFSGGLDKVIRMWDIFTGQLIRLLPTQHTSHITKIALFSAGILLSSSNDGTLKFWDYKAGGCIHTLDGPKVPISTFAITDDNAVLSIGQDKHIYVWD